MRQVVKVSIGVILCLILLPRVLAAQGASATSIVGVVKDTSGAVLPGVTVEAASPALIEKVRRTVTDDRGEYRIIQLRPGTYTVTFTLTGFGTFVRDGLELPTNFTATINAELRVGALQETVTVSGQTPLVDIQNVSQQKTMSKDLLDAVPTAKSVFSFMALMPAVVAPPNQQDVGGSQGEASTRITIHGSRRNDMKFLVDGMRVGSLNSAGAGRGFLINPLGAHEVVIEVGAGGSAEYSSGGAQINLIPKDGGNRFSGTFFTSYTNSPMQADNLTPALQAQGLTTVNGLRLVYDVNGVVGGPIVKDKLWFTTAHRRWGRTLRIGSLYHDSNLDDWIFTPDLSRSVDAPEDARSHGVRLTWQVSLKNKVTFSYEPQGWVSQVNAASLGPTNRAIEGQTRAMGSFCPDMRSIQATWSRPASNRLLFEAGVNHLSFNHRDQPKKGCPGGELDRVPITEQNLAVSPALWHGVGLRSWNDQVPVNGRVSMSYLTGGHNFKFGMFMLQTFGSSTREVRAPRDVQGLPVAYRFNTGVPNQVTQFVSPFFREEQAREVGLFAQDQWTLGRLTLNLGLRFEYMRQRSPAIQLEAGPLSDARSLDAVECIPCWKDLAPRAAVAYDLFGDGRTALKAGLGRYVESSTTEFANMFGPANATVASTTRTWTDANRNFFPDCDLRNPLANDECEQMANRSFGQTVVRTRPDPNWITGWGNRPYNWQASVSIDHELWPGVAVTAGYYRTWFGNFFVTDNLLVTPADFDPYCLTAPTDSRLGSISGSQICGLYDINPTKFGQVNNLVTHASNFGKYSEVYNGGDVAFQARFPRGAILAGGVNIGNSVGIPVGIGDVQSRTKRCFVVDSPQELYNCEAGNPYRTQFKLNGSIPLPWDLQAAAVYQNLPGTISGAAATFSGARVAAALGRPLAGGGNVTIDLFRPNSAFLKERIQQLDLRLSKKLSVQRARLQINLDAYNMLNLSPPLAVNRSYGTTGANWLQPQQILEARLFKVGVQVEF